MTSTSKHYGKIIVFKLADAEFAVPAAQLREIVSAKQVTKIPDTAACAEGILNFNGNIIPVLDVRELFGIRRKNLSGETEVIIADAGGVMTGIVSDTAAEAVDLTEQQIGQSAAENGFSATEFSQGKVRLGKRSIIMLDLQKIYEGIRKAQKADSGQPDSAKE